MAVSGSSAALVRVCRRVCVLCVWGAYTQGARGNAPTFRARHARDIAAWVWPRRDGGGGGEARLRA